MQKPTQGTIVNVATSLSAETLTPAGSAEAVADFSIYRGRVVRISTDADIFYRLDGTDATATDPCIPLAVGAERYEYVPDDGGISVIGTANVVIVLMG